MKNLYKKLISFLIPVILWLAPITAYLELDVVIGCIYVLLIGILIFVIKNTNRVLTVTAILTVLLCIYNFKYIPMYLPALLLVFAYSYILSDSENSDDKNKYELSSVFVTLSYIFSFINIIYSLINAENTENIKHMILKGYLTKSTLWIFILISFHWIRSYKNKKASNRDEKKRAAVLKRIYLAAFIGITVSYAAYMFTDSVFIMEKVSISFLSWFAFVAFIYLDDNVFL